MKNLKIEEIAKLEHCECESPCGACLEKYAHVFEKDEEKDWLNLTESKKQDCFKYLTLIKRTIFLKLIQ